MQTSESLERVAEELSKLPSIGRKTAHRIAMHLAKSSSEEVTALSDSLLQLKEKIKLCSICCNITEDDPCSICSSEKRNHKTDLFARSVAANSGGAYGGRTVRLAVILTNNSTLRARQGLCAKGIVVCNILLLVHGR